MLSWRNDRRAKHRASTGHLPLGPLLSIVAGLWLFILGYNIRPAAHTDAPAPFTHTVIRKVTVSPESPLSWTTAAPSLETYKVQSGDSLSSIATKKHVPLDQLYSANPGKISPEQTGLRVGETLRIPTKGK